MGIAEFSFGVAASLLATVIQTITNNSTISYFQQRRLNNRVDEAVSAVIEPILTNLQMEGVSEENQILLMEVCEDELRPFSKNSEMLFEGSLDGQKIFDTLYEKSLLPARIITAELNETYAIIFPRIATLLCKVPIAVKDWESNAWAENFRRLDELTSDLQELFQKVDALAISDDSHQNSILSNIRRALAQILAFKLDLTGLRGEKPIAGKFDDFYVYPQIRLLREKEEDETPQLLISERNEIFSQFILPDSKAIIFGSAGSGKSTWSQWLQREVLGEQWKGIPVRIELRNLDIENLPSIQKIIRDTAGVHHTEEVTTESTQSWLKEKNVLFILDGFDEIHESKRDTLIEWVKGLSLASNNCPILITSRPLITNHLEELAKSGWGKWEIQPFNKERIIEYMRKWYENVPLSIENEMILDIHSLANEWISDSTIQPLTGNPLLLSTLLMVHHLDGRLPTGRAKLYQRYVDGLLGIWDDRRKIRAKTLSLSLEQKKQILRNFALQLQYLNKDTLEEEETISIIQLSLKELGLSCDAKETLDLLRERSGLIVGPGLYSFIHKSVGEYLVAETVVQGDQRTPEDKRIDRFSLFNHRNDDRWNNIIFLWAGLAPVSDLEVFINTCNEHKELALAYGLLLDQYDRFSQKLKADIFLGLLRYSEWPVPTNQGTLLGLSYPNKYREVIRIEMGNLRGITLNSSLRDICIFLLRDKILTPDMLGVLDTKIKLLIWQYIGWSTTDIEIWKALMQLKKPNIVPSEVVMMITADWAFNKKEKTELFLASIPNLQKKPELIVLSAMSTFIFNNRDSITDKSMRQIEIDSFSKIFLRYSTIAKFTKTLFKKTTKWNLTFSSKGYGDLFVDFREILDFLEKEYEVSDLKKAHKNLLSKRINLIGK